MKPKIFIVTGTSGSGKSTVAKTFEDFGYYCVDNLPVTLIPQLLHLISSAGEEINKVCLVVDVREGKFLDKFTEIYKSLKEQGYFMKILYLDASKEVLKSRFKETRRRHPLKEGYNLDETIEKEKEMLEPIKNISDILIDTSTMNIHQLKERLKKIEGLGEEKEIEINLISFGFKFGIPTDADMIIDTRCLPNPFFKEELRPFDGTDPKVRDFVINNEETKEFLSRLMKFLEYFIELSNREGRVFVNIAFGCTGGKHRSIAIAHYCYEELKKKWKNVSIFHKDIDK